MNMVKILSIISMSPEHAKAFAEALIENVKKYEDGFGEITLTNQMKADAKSSSKIGFQIQKNENK